MIARIAAAGLVVGLGSTAQAQVHAIDQTARFSLKPAPRLTWLQMRTTDDIRTPALDRPSTPPPRDTATIDIQILRQTAQFSQQRVSGTPATAPIAPHQSRTRIRSIMVEGLVPIDGRAQLRLGWSGAKYSNRNANVTAVYTNANLRAKDWFQPHAAFSWTASRDVLLHARYDEMLLAYADVGMSGPLGLTRDDFRQVKDALRPERHRRLQVGATMAAATGLKLSLDLYGGRIDDRLMFVAGGALPINQGSAGVRGGAVVARRQFTPTISGTMRYMLARIDRSDGGEARETQWMAEGRWQDGPWRASLRATRSSAPALIIGRSDDRALRIDAAIAYQPVRLPGMTLGLHLADPDRLATSAFLGTGAPLGLRAQDQARTLLLSARMAL